MKFYAIAFLKNKFGLEVKFSVAKDEKDLVANLNKEKGYDDYILSIKKIDKRKEDLYEVWKNRHDNDYDLLIAEVVDTKRVIDGDNVWEMTCCRRRKISPCIGKIFLCKTQ